MAFDNFKRVVTQVLQLSYNGNITFGDGSTQAVATGYNLIEAKSFTGSDLAFTTLPSGYKKLVMIVEVATTTGFSGALNATFNAGALGSWSQMNAGTATLNTGTATANFPLASSLQASTYVLEVHGYAKSNPKAVANTGNPAGILVGSISNALTDIALKAGTSWGTATGTATLYGIN